MNPWEFTRVLGLATALLLPLSGPVAAAEGKTVAEEILDILKEEGRISDSQYDLLTKRARQEMTERELPAVSSVSEWDGYWKDGLTFENKSKGIKVRAGGRLQMDFADINADNDIALGLGAPDLNGGSGSEVRRARLFFDGTLWERMGFKLQLDLADGDADLKDAYLRFLKIPHVQQVTVGHFKEPFSLEELISSKYNTFMERSVMNALTPGRNAGIAIGGPVHDEQMTWSLGAFRNVDDFGASFDDDEVWNVSGRVTGVPYWADEGEKLVHLGFGYTHTNSGGDLRFRARPEAHLSPVRFVDTGAFAADSANKFGAELAANYGPLSLQGEANWTLVDSEVGDDPEFFGYYVQASYFLTGEHRPYKRRSGTFDRVKPKENFGFDGGHGAWQLAARYSYLSLNDGFVNGGRISDVTAGLNWFVNPNVRFLFNYVFSDLSSGPRGLGAIPAGAKFDGDADILQARMQVDF